MLLSKSSLDLESSLAENDAILRFERKTRPNPGGEKTTSIARPLKFSIPVFHARAKIEGLMSSFWRKEKIPYF
jgi:hypothetical protein